MKYLYQFSHNTTLLRFISKLETPQNQPQVDVSASLNVLKNQIESQETEPIVDLEKLAKIKQKLQSLPGQVMKLSIEPHGLMQFSVIDDGRSLFCKFLDKPENSSYSGYFAIDLKTGEMSGGSNDIQGKIMLRNPEFAQRNITMIVNTFFEREVK